MLHKPKASAYVYITLKQSARERKRCGVGAVILDYEILRRSALFALCSVQAKVRRLYRIQSWSLTVVLCWQMHFCEKIYLYLQCCWWNQHLDTTARPNDCEAVTIVYTNKMMRTNFVTMACKQFWYKLYKNNNLYKNAFENHL